MKARIAALKGCATSKGCATRRGGIVALALIMVAQPFRAAGQQPPIQFETRTDLILIDATIVDGKGVPLADLEAKDFTIAIDGKPRQVASIQYVKADASPDTPAAARPAHYSTNEGASSGRRILLVVDENSISPGGARAVLMSTERFLKGLAAADHVAFIRLPGFEESVDFTTDRSRVFEAVKKVTGKALRVGFGRVSVAEAVAYERRDAFEWDRAITRICAGQTGVELEVCRQDAEGEATEMMQAYLRRARETLSGLGQLVNNVRQVPGPKTLVLLSQGFLGYDYRSDISRLADAAAAARVAFYAMHIDMPSFDISDSTPSMTRNEDERLMAEGIDDLAGASRGARFRIVGSGENVFARVARELAGYYLIGVEPTDADRDGKPHRIKVSVTRPDVTVRSRAQFTIAGAVEATAPAPPADRLLQLLRAATAESGIPLRITAFTAPASTSGRVKVIVGADIGPPASAPLAVHVGFVLLDGNGKAAGNQLGSLTLQPQSGDKPAPLRYLGNVEVLPGSYNLRFAVIDPEGRSGSVHHAVDATLKQSGGVAVSDLILTAPVRGRDAVRPEVHLNLEGSALQTMLELSGSDLRRVGDTRVTFEVAEKADGESLVSRRGSIRNGEGSVRPAVAILDVGVLPPGAYVARAVVAVPDQKPLVTTRPFEIAPRRQRTAPLAENPGRSPARAASRGRMKPPIPPFKKEDVLAPQVLHPFVDHVLESYSPSPAARDALDAIKAGDLQRATKGDRQIGDVGMSFAQGVGYLAADRPAEADAYFRAALRSSSDFIGAAFYLGATLAAAGKDRDAVGAWQTALIGDVGAAGVYPVLIDGLLRLGEAERALEMLKEAEATFSDRDQYARRLAQALALAGRYDEALPAAHAYLAKFPDDADMLFLTMHMIYEAHAAGELADRAAEMARFRDYAARYEAARAPQAAVVRGWRKALGIS
jgi:VWFA-related protein